MSKSDKTPNSYRPPNQGGRPRKYAPAPPPSVRQALGPVNGRANRQPSGGVNKGKNPADNSAKKAEKKPLNVNVYGILSAVFGGIGFLMFGMWAAFFPIATGIIMAFFGLFDNDKKKWTAVLGLCLSAAGMLLCAVNLLLMAGPVGTVFSADKGIESRFYGYGDYYDDDYYYDDWDDDYYDDEDDEDYYYDDEDEEWDYEEEDDEDEDMSDDEYDPSIDDYEGYDNSDYRETASDPYSDRNDNDMANNADYGNVHQEDLSSIDATSGSAAGNVTESYQTIYEEYAAALKSMGDSYAAQITEAGSRNDDSVDIGELYYELEEKLDDKLNEGTDKLFDYMDENDADYDEYDSYYDKLYDVYEAAYDKLYDAYNGI